METGHRASVTNMYLGSILLGLARKEDILLASAVTRNNSGANGTPTAMLKSHNRLVAAVYALQRIFTDPCP